VEASSCVHVVTNTAIRLPDNGDDDEDDDQIGKMGNSKNIFMNVLSCAVRQIERMWFRF